MTPERAPLTASSNSNESACERRAPQKRAETCVERAKRAKRKDARKPKCVQTCISERRGGEAGWLKNAPGGGDWRSRKAARPVAACVRASEANAEKANAKHAKYDALRAEKYISYSLYVSPAKADNHWLANEALLSVSALAQAQAHGLLTHSPRGRCRCRACSRFFEIGRAIERATGSAIGNAQRRRAFQERGGI